MGPTTPPLDRGAGDPADGTAAAGPIVTVGHGTLEAGAFVALAREAAVEAVVDVRRYPGSRRHPHFGRDELARWLPDAGISYRWAPALGGRRSPDPTSVNVGLRNQQFRAYADHMGTEDFAVGVTDLRQLAATRRTAVMCAESLWWRCHRRLLADHLVLVSDTPVEHLFHDGRLVDHPVTAEARRSGDHVTYVGEAAEQPPGEARSS